MLIRGNEIYDIGASAIAFVGRPEAVRSPLFEYRQSQPLAEIDRIVDPLVTGSRRTVSRRRTSSTISDK